MEDLCDKGGRSRVICRRVRLRLQEFRTKSGRGPKSTCNMRAGPNSKQAICGVHSSTREDRNIRRKLRGKDACRAREQLNTHVAHLTPGTAIGERRDGTSTFAPGELRSDKTDCCVCKFVKTWRDFSSSAPCHPTARLLLPPPVPGGSTKT